MCNLLVESTNSLSYNAYILTTGVTCSAILSVRSSATKCNRLPTFQVSLMSLSAIALCTASQWVFTDVDVMHNPQFVLYDFKEQHICVKFCSKLTENCTGNV